MKRTFEGELMRNLKILLAALLLAIPSLAAAAASDIPGTATWYFHIDLAEMRSADAGKVVYDWMSGEVFEDVKEETGVDIEGELDRVTAFSMEGQGPVFLFEGDISQVSQDRLMTFIAAEGDLKPLKSSGKSYYRFNGRDSDGEVRKAKADDGNIEIQFDSLEDESWISMDLKNKVIVTGNEQQMQEMLKSGGKISGSRGHKGALVVLTAEKTLLQAGMNSSALGGDDDDDSGWDSNILRNTEQVAFLVAAAENKLAIEAQFVTAEPEMAQSLASVARGLISLTAFSDDMDADAIAVLQGTKVEAKGNNLTISLAIDPDLVVSTLND
jgi:hypothetical protein